MSNNKRYYWLKLKKDFFRQKPIKKLRRVAGGDTYVLIYLEMQLLSIESDGVLFFEGYEDTFEEELALELDEDVENVRMTIMFLLKNNLLEIKSQTEYFVPEAAESIGSETSVAERVRKHRKKMETLRCNAKSLQSNTGVTKCNTEKEIEIETEKDKDLEKDIYSPARPDIPPLKTSKIKNLSEKAKDIIDYLNAKLNTKYKADNKKTLELIKARLNEGFTVEDFKTVIDKKAFEWGQEPNMCQYLRPVTLFSNKFESYLNQPFTKKLSESEKNIADIMSYEFKGDYFDD